MLAAMALTMLPRLDALNEARRQVAARLDDGLGDVAGLTIVRAIPGSHAVYLRYAFLAADQARRDALLGRLRDRGIGATGSYPTSIIDIPELAAIMRPFREACPMGRDVARRIVTLPTHAYVTPRDVEVMCDIIRGAPRAYTTARAAHAPEVRP